MKSSKFFFIISVLLNLILIGYLFYSATNEPFDIQGEHKYKYLSKRIFITDQNDLLINFVPLREKLQNYSRSKNFTTGIYFEYLPSGNSIGIKEQQQFIPASLLKMPLAMGALKKIENGKIDPNQEVVLSAKDLDDRFGDLWKKGVGYSLTFQDALEILIKDSDNTAQHVIFDHLSGGEVDDVFDSLDIPKERDASNSAVVTPKNYSSILRCLYLSCYMSEENSNKMLHMLAHTQYKDKLPAGVPAGIPVAHKIGVVESDNEKEPIYSDCGIVYAPQRPYILCLMAKTDESAAREFMRDVSKAVYDYVHTTTP